MHFKITLTAHAQTQTQVSDSLANTAEHLVKKSTLVREHFTLKATLLWNLSLHMSVEMNPSSRTAPLLRPLLCHEFQGDIYLNRGCTVFKSKLFWTIKSPHFTGFSSPTLSHAAFCSFCLMSGSVDFMSAMTPSTRDLAVCSSDSSVNHSSCGWDRSRTRNSVVCLRKG